MRYHVRQLAAVNHEGEHQADADDEARERNGVGPGLEQRRRRGVRSRRSLQIDEQESKEQQLDGNEHQVITDQCIIRVPLRQFRA